MLRQKGLAELGFSRAQGGQLVCTVVVNFSMHHFHHFSLAKSMALLRSHMQKIRWPLLRTEFLRRHCKYGQQIIGFVFGSGLVL